MSKLDIWDGYEGPRLSPERQLKRLRKVIANELTPIQQEILTAYYFDKKKMAQIAKERGVCLSTVSRTLHRAVNRVRRCLKY